MQPAVDIDAPADDTGSEPVDRLLDANWQDRRVHAARRELLTESALAASFLVAAGLFTLVSSQRAPDLYVVVALVLAYAAMAAVLFPVGAGYGVPTQLILVPMLLLAPINLVPLMVALGLLLSTLPGVLRRREPAHRLVSAVGDGWHALGAAAPVAIFGEPGPWIDHTGVFALSFAMQGLTDAAAAVLRERAGRAIRIADQVGALGKVQLVDLLFWPLGLLAAFAGIDHPYGWVLVLPAGALLALLARDRSAHVASAQHRLAALRRERERSTAAVRRLGEALAAGFDRDALLRLAVDACAEAVSAPVAVLHAPGVPAYALGTATAQLRATLDAAARRAWDGGVVEARQGDWQVLGCAMRTHPSERGVASLAVARRGEPFSDAERELLADLARQAAISAEHVELHERLGLQATTDGLTGLANHRALLESLERELARAQREDGSLALLLIDIDDFKAINDDHGHLTGDLVLQQVAALLNAESRAVDTAARYGGEEFAVVLPAGDAEAALAAAERTRIAIADAALLAHDGSTLRCSVSIGVAVRGPGRETATDLVSAADGALYEAKRHGKNRTVAAGAVVVPAGR